MFQLRQGKCLLRDDKGKVVFPAKLIDNDKVSLEFDYKDIKKFLRSNHNKQFISSSSSDLKDNGENFSYSSQSSSNDDVVVSSLSSSQNYDELANINRKKEKEALSNVIKDLNNNHQCEAKASTTISKSYSLDESKPLVKRDIHGLAFNALLDACSSGPQGYIVNYIHPDVVKLVSRETHHRSWMVFGRL